MGVALVIALIVCGAGLAGAAPTHGADAKPIPVLPADPTPTPTPTPSPTPDGPTVLGATVTLAGRGYGHGVGMSQYGARGRALDGQDAPAILAHYYRKTTLGALPDAPVIRVLVLDDWRSSPTKPLTIYGRTTEWTVSGVEGVFPPDAKLTLTPATSGTGATASTAWRIRVTAPDGSVLADRAAPPTFTLRGGADDWRVHLRSKRGTRDVYRGALRVIPSTSSPTVDVVNRVDLEAYLRGVVPAEMPSSWPTEALRAQAIAARSYAVRKLRPGVGAFDAYDDSRSQVYLGALGERIATDAAIADTAGIVLWSSSTVANAMFHSTGGGGTEHNENVYVSATGARVAGKVSYLRGSSDRREDGTAFDEAAPYATWTMRTYTRAQLSAWFGADHRTDVGALTALDLRARGVSGRLIKVTLIGTGGAKTVSATVFRSVLNAAIPTGDPIMRSTLFDTQPLP